MHVGLEILVPMAAVLWAISLLPLAKSIKTWWTASAAEGPWEGITYGTRLLRRARIECYEHLLVHQLKAYSRVQPGEVHTIAVERVFEPQEASTTLRIAPQVLLPLDPVKHRTFAALRWSSGVQHETSDAVTVLRVQWDLGAFAGGLEGRTVRVPARWDRRAGTAVGIVVVLAIVLSALGPWFRADSGPSTDTAALVYAAPRPGGMDSGDGGQSRPYLTEPAPAWAVDEVDLQAPSHSDLCPPSAQVATTPRQHCEAVTTFTPGHPITITALGVDAYGVLADHAVRLVVWEFDGNPSTKIVQSVGPFHDWQVIRLQEPMTAATVTATVVDAVAAGPTAGDQPSKSAGRYRLIGIGGQAQPQSTNPEPARTH
ncbi:MAG: hypothetical protein WCE30_24115 [Mycobacterium sp.]